MSPLFTGSSNDFSHFHISITLNIQIITFKDWYNHEPESTSSPFISVNKPSHDMKSNALLQILHSYLGLFTKVTITFISENFQHFFIKLNNKGLGIPGIIVKAINIQYEPNHNNNIMNQTIYCNALNFGIMVTHRISNLGSSKKLALAEKYVPCLKADYTWMFYDIHRLDSLSS